MSYEIPMSFLRRPIANRSDALAFAADMTERIVSDDDLVRQIIEHEQHQFFLAFMSCGLHDDQLMLDRNMAIVSMAIDKVIASLFTIRYTYWPKYQLLGVSCSEFLAGKIGGMNHVFFQNANNQDYDYDEWSDDIALFASLKKEAMVADIPVPEDSSVDLAYYRRSKLYGDIFDALQLNQLLYGRDSDAFTRFAFQGITTTERQLDIYMKAKHFLYRTEPFRIAKAFANISLHRIAVTIFVTACTNMSGRTIPGLKRLVVRRWKIRSVYIPVQLYLSMVQFKREKSNAP